METITGCEHLSDDELLAGAKRLAAEERGTTEKLLRHLSEIGHRKLHERERYATLFLYCLRELKLSEAESWRRSVVAEAARRYPVIYDLVRDGELTLAVAALLAPHLNAGNYRTLLRRCAGMAKREVEGVLADLQGRKETPDRVRNLAAAPAPASEAAAEGGGGAQLPLSSAPSASVAAAPASVVSPAPCDPPRAAAAQAARRVEIKFTADEALWRKLERIRELLRFRVEGARLEHVLGVIAEFWLAKHAPERVLLERRPRAGMRTGAPGGGKRSRRVPTAIKAEVYRRDEGRCSFVSPSGARCEETARLEFDHRVPYARGGRSDDPGALRLLCRAHNLRAAREIGLGRDRGRERP